MVNGVLEGKFETFDENGNLEIRMSYVDGILSGPSETYYKGIITTRRVYQNNKLNGPATIFSSNELVNAEVIYLDGEIDGEARYYSHGKTSRVVNYRKGLMEGLSKQFSETGILIYQAEYKNGELHGISKTFSADGVLVEISFYENGKEDKEKSADATASFLDSQEEEKGIKNKLSSIFRGED